MISQSSRDIVISQNRNVTKLILKYHKIESVISQSNFNILKTITIVISQNREFTVQGYPYFWCFARDTKIPTSNLDESCHSDAPLFTQWASNIIMT